MLTTAGRNILRGRVFDENFLMTIATLGAIAIHELPEAVAVMLFFQVGELFQGYSVGRSRRSINALLEVRPDTANLKVDGEIRTVSPEAVSVGDIIVVRPGEKVPLDGEIVAGTSQVDTSALTGESVPRTVTIGETVLSGMINQSGGADGSSHQSLSRIFYLKNFRAGRKRQQQQSRHRKIHYPLCPLLYPGVVFLSLAVAILTAAVYPRRNPGRVDLSRPGAAGNLLPLRFSD